MVYRSIYMLLKSSVVLAVALLGCFLLPGGAGASEVAVLDPLYPVRDVSDMLAAGARDQVRLVVPRNGHASAVIAVSGWESGTAVSDGLSLQGGQAPLLELRIRYAVKAPEYGLLFDKLGAGSDPDVLRPYYDVLLNGRPAGVAFVPVWVSVNPSRDTVPGIYKGTVSVAGKTIPVTAEVSAWVCPAPAEWVTHAGVLASPETLAQHYGLPLWSEGHWGLVKKEIELLAGLGNDDLWLSVFPSNHLGQATPWITFSRVGGRLKPDLKLVSEYFRVYDQIAGAPEHLLLDLWNSSRAPARRSETEAKVAVVVDGKVESVPHPGHKGSEDVWPELLDGIRKAVEEVGWKSSALILGCADDRRPAGDTVAFFQKHAPDMKWAIWTHGRGDPAPWKGQLKIGGMEIIHYEHLFVPTLGGTSENGIVGGWDLSFPEYGSARNLLPRFAPPSQYRCLAEGMTVSLGKLSSQMSRNSAGFTRVCLDYWPVKVPGTDGKVDSLLIAYETKPWSIFYRNNTRSIVEPAADGPTATVRYEMLREGLQECEARIFLEARIKTGELPAQLEASVREHLRGRHAARESDGRFEGGHASNILGAKEFLWGVPPDWQSSAMRLFDLAAAARKE